MSLSQPARQTIAHSSESSDSIAGHIGPWNKPKNAHPTQTSQMLPSRAARWLPAYSTPNAPSAPSMLAVSSWDERTLHAPATADASLAPVKNTAYARKYTSAVSWLVPGLFLSAHY